MRNYVQDGVAVTVPAPYDLASGGGALVGSMFGVAQYAVLSGVDVPLVTRGVFDLPKATGAVTVGAKLYWDNTNKVLTTTASGNTLVGVATAAAQSGDATARARLGIVA